MTLPGIIRISYLKCSDLDPNLGFVSLSGIPVSIGNTSTIVSFCGDPECESVSQVENNGRFEKTTLSFHTTEEIPVELHLAFLITTAGGQQYLIGTKEDIPTVEITTTTGTPSGDTSDYTVEVTLTAIKSLIPLAN